MDIKQYLTAIDEADRQHSPSQRASFADVLVDEIRDIFGCDDKRLCEVLQAERDGRLVVLPCKVGELKNKYKELTKPTGDGAETYTTGYRSGHKNGQAELIAFLLQVDTGTRAEAEVALKGGEKDG